MSQKDVIARIFEAAKRKNLLKPETISTFCGFNRSWLRVTIERGNMPRAASLQKIAESLEVDPGWLLNGSSQADQVQSLRRGLATRSEVEPIEVSFDPARLPLDIPVLGTAAASGTEHGAFTIDGQIDVVRRPPGLAGARNVYALFVGGFSMVPRYRPGDLILVSADRPATSGDDVIIQTQNYEGAPVRAWIKELVKRTETEIVVRQLNPESTVTFAIAQVIALHRVIPLREMLGV